MDSKKIRRVWEVQKYSDVSNPKLTHQLTSARPDGSYKARRIDVLGLPGLGKSSLLRRLFDKFGSLSFSVFAIPEAANYAVLNQGYTLKTMEAFLTRFYFDAERLAIVAARAIPNLIVLREPSALQNHAYLVMQRALRPKASPAITKLVKEYCRKREWPQNLETVLWSQVQERILAALASGEPWEKRFVVLTTGHPEEDLRLSIKRQRQPDRDPRLATTDCSRLCSYLTAIRGIANHLRRLGTDVQWIHPGHTPEEIEREIVARWPGWFVA